MVKRLEIRLFVDVFEQTTKEEVLSSLVNDIDSKINAIVRRVDLIDEFEVY